MKKRFHQWMTAAFVLVCIVFYGFSDASGDAFGATEPLPPAPVQRERSLEQRVADMAWHYRVPGDIAHAVVTVESAWDADAISSTGDIGLMQVNPDLAGLDVNRIVHGIDRVPSVEQLMSPSVNIDIGVAYLHILYGRYFAEADLSIRWELAVAGYNAGPTAILRHVDVQRTRTLDQLYRQLPEDALRYVRRVNAVRRKVT